MTATAVSPLIVTPIVVAFLLALAAIRIWALGAGERSRLAASSAALASREQAVVSAVASVDLDAPPLDANALPRFVRILLDQQKPCWKLGDLASITRLFGSHVWQSQPPGSYGVIRRGRPLTRVVDCIPPCGDEGWHIVVQVQVRLSSRARSWRIVRSDLGYRQAEVLGAYWTLSADGDGWKIDTVETLANGRHHLSAKLPGTLDDAELHDEATIDVAVADESSPTPPAELTDISTSIRAQLLDLSTLDGRFEPDAIASSVRTIVRAWATATHVSGGDRRALQACANENALAQLCHPTPNGIRRVAELQVGKIEIRSVSANDDPPVITVEVHLRGLRWLDSRFGGMPLSGNDAGRRRFTEHWTLRLDASTTCPWRLTDVEHPGHP
jgi:hypothetical protein